MGQKRELKNKPTEYRQSGFEEGLTKLTGSSPKDGIDMQTNTKKEKEKKLDTYLLPRTQVRLKT